MCAWSHTDAGPDTPRRAGVVHRGAVNINAPSCNVPVGSGGGGDQNG